MYDTYTYPNDGWSGQVSSVSYVYAHSYWCITVVYCCQSVAFSHTNRPANTYK